MQPKPHIQSIIEYIERNLAAGLDIQHLTKRCFLSPMQLYRDFYSVTGHSVKEYIRKRRLSNAMALVKHSEMPLADIAMEWGYSSQQAFCKHVKSTLGQSPLEYRNGDCYYYFPPYNSQNDRQVSVASECIPETVRARYYHSSLENIERNAMRSLFSLLPGYRGRIFGRNGKQDGNRFCYELYIQGIDARDLAEGEFTSLETVSSFNNSFATVIVDHKEDAIFEAWNYLCIDWLNRSMFVQSERPYFEEYIIRQGTFQKLKLYLPLHKRSDFPRITLTCPGEMVFLVSEKMGPRAEEAAAAAVTGFAAVYFPHLLKSEQEFYVSRMPDACICGIRVAEALELPQNSEIKLLRVEGDTCCAMLQESGGGDYTVYDQILSGWINDNGLLCEDEPAFAVYQAISDTGSVQQKLYRRLKKW
ncbi:helix-turn-helix transcriptional regulator [Paenibacillus sp. GCM10012306]|uniref:helix-turn-helix transcriptional regulator n=1 Tax=Paenibacillus sp. GCM10012306 TaxID=3317342 RepID=UPI0036212F5A